MTKTLLIICTGNTCRSPYAALLLQDMLGDYKVVSAGIKAITGQGVSSNCQTILDGCKKLQAEKHYATKLNYQMCQSADIIYAMENEHIEHVGKISPSSKNKTQLLGVSIGNIEIADPFNHSLATYKERFTLIDKACVALEKILN